MKYTTSRGTGSNHMYRWAHEICSEDNEERSLVIGSMNEMAYVVQAWLPLIVWQQVDAPKYHKGFITVSCLSVVLIITAFVLRSLDHREKESKKLGFSSSSMILLSSTD